MRYHRKMKFGTLSMIHMLSMIIYRKMIHIFQSLSYRFVFFCFLPLKYKH